MNQAKKTKLLKLPQFVDNLRRWYLDERLSWEAVGNKVNALYSVDVTGETVRNLARTLGIKSRKKWAKNVELNNTRKQLFKRKGNKSETLAMPARKNHDENARQKTISGLNVWLCDTFGCWLTDRGCEDHNRVFECCELCGRQSVSCIGGTMEKGEFLIDRRILSGQIEPYSIEDLTERMYRPYFHDGSNKGLAPREEKLLITAYLALKELAIVEVGGNGRTDRTGSKEKY